MARGLYSKAELFILDDVFSSLDKETSSTIRVRMFSETSVLKDENMTFIMTTSFRELIHFEDLQGLSFFLLFSQPSIWWMRISFWQSMPKAESRKSPTQALMPAQPSSRGNCAVDKCPVTANLSALRQWKCQQSGYLRGHLMRLPKASIDNIPTLHYSRSSLAPLE